MEIVEIEKIQSAVLDLLKSNPNGCWWTTRLTERIYQRTPVSHYHCTKVTFAIRQMTLPSFWIRATRTNHTYLYNAGSEESTLRLHFLSSGWRFRYDYNRDFEEWKLEHPEYVRAVHDRVKEVIKTGKIIKGPLLPKSET